MKSVGTKSSLWWAEQNEPNPTKKDTIFTITRQDTDESQTAVKPEEPNSEEQSRKQIYYTKNRTLLTKNASGQEIQNTKITPNGKVLDSSTKALKQNNDPKQHEKTNNLIYEHW